MSKKKLKAERKPYQPGVTDTGRILFTNDYVVADFEEVAIDAAEADGACDCESKRFYIVRATTKMGDYIRLTTAVDSWLAVLKGETHSSLARHIVAQGGGIESEKVFYLDSEAQDDFFAAIDPGEESTCRLCGQEV